MQKNILDFKKYNKIINFDKKKGLIKVQCGVTIKDILNQIIPEGWFFPVLPGCKYISIGGMIAANVHGKNHLIAGSFKKHVTQIKVITKEKKIKIINSKDKKNFNLYFGTMGLMGIILEATIKLFKIETSYIKQKTYVTRNLQDTIKYFINNKNKLYIVGWVDALTKKSGRAVIFTGSHVKKKDIKKKFFKVIKDKTIDISFFFPKIFLNNFFIKIFNLIFYYKSYFFSHKKERIIDYNKFFFPLDNIKNWNKLYGKKGFAQFQCILPINKKILSNIISIFSIIKKNKESSFLTVIKLLKKEKGLLSFYENGITIAIDFPRNDNTQKLFLDLHELVIKSKGKIYLTKDTYLTRKQFQKMYTISNNLKLKFYSNKSKLNLSSLQSERIGLTETNNEKNFR